MFNTKIKKYIIYSTFNVYLESINKIDLHTYIVYNAGISRITVKFVYSIWVIVVIRQTAVYNITTLLANTYFIKLKWCLKYSLGNEVQLLLLFIEKVGKS